MTCQASRVFPNERTMGLTPPPSAAPVVAGVDSSNPEEKRLKRVSGMRSSQAPCQSTSQRGRGEGERRERKGGKVMARARTAGRQWEKAASQAGESKQKQCSCQPTSPESEPRSLGLMALPCHVNTTLDFLLSSQVRLMVFRAMVSRSYALYACRTLDELHIK